MNSKSNRFGFVRSATVALTTALMTLPGSAFGVWYSKDQSVEVKDTPENRGMIEPIMDISRRYAKEGFVALAVDLISRASGTASFGGDIMAIMAAHGRQTDATRLADMLAALEYLKTLPFVNSAAGFGVTGFCFGGGQTFSLAARSPDIKAAAPFYGSTMPDALAGTQAAFVVGQDVLRHGVDVRIAAQHGELGGGEHLVLPRDAGADIERDLACGIRREDA